MPLVKDRDLRLDADRSSLNATPGREIGALAFVLALLFSCSALADGAVVQGFKRDGTAYTTTRVSVSSAQNARAAALTDCQQNASQCQVIHEFKNTCVATVLFNDRLVDVGSGETKEAAEADAKEICNQRGGSACKPQYSGCDSPNLVVTEQKAQPRSNPAPTTTAAPTAASQEFLGSLMGFLITTLLLLAIIAGSWYADYLYAHKDDQPIDLLKGLADPFNHQLDPGYVGPTQITTPEITKAAETQLQVVWNCVSRLPAKIPPTLPYPQCQQWLHDLELAAKHLVKARELDDTAELTVVENKRTNKHTQHFLAAIILRLEGMIRIHMARKSDSTNQAQWNLLQGIGALRYSAAFHASPEAYVHIARAYAYAGHLNEGMGYIEQALYLDNHHTEAVELSESLKYVDPIATRREPEPSKFRTYIWPWFIPGALFIDIVINRDLLIWAFGYFITITVGLISIGVVVAVIALYVRSVIHGPHEGSYDEFKKRQHEKEKNEYKQQVWKDRYRKEQDKW